MPAETSIRHSFAGSWEQTTTAFWNKYPNDKLQHVRECLVLSRQVDDQGILHSTRLIHIEQPMPSIIQKCLCMKDTSYYAIEKSSVDPDRKILTMETTNVTFSSMVEAKETCIYSQNQTDSSKTDYSWKLAVDSRKKIPLVSTKIETALVNRAEENAGKGLSIMAELVRCSFRDGKLTKYATLPTVNLN